MLRNFLASLMATSVMLIPVAPAFAQKADELAAAGGTTSESSAIGVGQASATPALTPAALQEAAKDTSIRVVAPGYRINPGDQLEIYVWGEERLQRTVKVLPDGTMAFPLVGQLSVSGMLPSELERLISDRLQPQYRGQVPQVTVSVVSPAGLQFSVMGKVKTPGTFSPGRYVNLLEALSLAGGPITFANLDNVLVYRKAADGAMSIVRVKLAPYFKPGVELRVISRDEIPSINSGDTVVVP